jgi:hypothetical protein
MLHSASDFAGFEKTCATENGKMEWKIVEWIYRAQDRDKWPAVMSTVIVLRVP